MPSAATQINSPWNGWRILLPGFLQRSVAKPWWLLLVAFALELSGAMFAAIFGYIPMVSDLFSLSTDNMPDSLYALGYFMLVLLPLTILAGLFFPTVVYPTEELRRSSVSNDVVSLFIGLPILLGSMAFTWRGSLLGLLFWPGALFYTTYNYTTYAVAMPFTLPFVPFLALVLLSVYIIYHLLSSVDAAAVQAQLQGKVTERFTGGALIGFSILMFLLAVGALASAVSGQVATSWPELAVRIADLLIAPAWLVGGILLWRRRAFGYVIGAGLLFQASMLFVSLFIFFILRPFVAGVPFPMQDFVVVAVMSLICFIPFALFVRGVASKEG